MKSTTSGSRCVRLGSQPNALRRHTGSKVLGSLSSGVTWHLLVCEHLPMLQFIVLADTPIYADVHTTECHRLTRNFDCDMVRSTITWTGTVSEPNLTV